MDDNLLSLDGADPSEVLRQRNRMQALRRQSVMRARRESTGAIDNLHHRRESATTDDTRPHTNNDDDADDEDNGQPQQPVNGIG